MPSYSFNTPSGRSKAKGRLTSATGAADASLPVSSRDASVAVSTKARHISNSLKNTPVAVLDLVSVIRRQTCATRPDGSGADPSGYGGSSFLMNAQQRHSSHSPFQKQFELLPHPRGITNSSNFCFMNSILQSLLFIPPFAQLVLSISNLTSPTVSQHCTTLVALSRWAALYWREDGATQRSVQPPRLPFLAPPTRSLGRREGGVDAATHPAAHRSQVPYLNGSTQQDAQEFLQKLLETIDAELFSLELAVWESGACSVEEFVDYEEQRRIRTKSGSDVRHGGVAGSCSNGDSARSISRRRHGVGASLEAAADGMRSGDVSTMSGGGKAAPRRGSQSAEPPQVNLSHANNVPPTSTPQRAVRREGSSGSNDRAWTKSTLMKGSQQQQQQNTRADKKWTFIKDNDRLAVREHMDSKGSSSLLQHIFGGTIESHLKGGRSRQRNITSVLVEHYYSLPIDIGFAAECTLEEAIEHSCTTERIYDEDRDKDMRKTLLLSQLPNILFIHVRRWAITAEGETVKLDNVLHFKRALVIPQGVCADKLTHQARSYSLLSAVAHRGRGVEVGHYITYLAKHAASPVSPVQPARDARQYVVIGTAKDGSANPSRGRGGAPAGGSAANKSSAHEQPQQQRNSPSSEYVLLCNDAKVSLCPIGDMMKDSVYFLVYQKNKQP